MKIADKKSLLEKVLIFCENDKKVKTFEAIFAVAALMMGNH